MVRRLRDTADAGQVHRDVPTFFYTNPLADVTQPSGEQVSMMLMWCVNWMESRGFKEYLCCYNTLAGSGWQTATLKRVREGSQKKELEQKSDNLQNAEWLDFQLLVPNNTAGYGISRRVPLHHIRQDAGQPQSPPLEPELPKPQTPKQRPRPPLQNPQ